MRISILKFTVNWLVRDCSQPVLREVGIIYCNTWPVWPDVSLLGSGSVWLSGEAGRPEACSARDQTLGLAYILDISGF